MSGFPWTNRVQRRAAVAGGAEAQSELPQPLASGHGSHRHGSGQRGFALVLVIWGLGLISLIALTVITSERYQVLAAANLVENAKAEALAEAGVNLRRLVLHAAFSSGP